jgi:hypothetical protein
MAKVLSGVLFYFVISSWMSTDIALREYTGISAGFRYEYKMPELIRNHT